ncbi:ABC transporter permease [Streptomyces sp. NPDC001288]|uniref:ABC transporter permease n=1 Tax=unclassified Streptomyces TaxID=2593676 RepID=UPI00331C0E76
MTHDMTTHSRLRAGDLMRLGVNGLSTRPLRAVLSAAGIAIGIAAMIAVIGISSSSQAELNAELNKLGTNLLVVVPGENPDTNLKVPLPTPAVQTIARAPGVDSASGVAELVDVYTYRNEHVDPAETNSLTVLATDTRLLHTLKATLHRGGWLDRAPDRYPTAVLGKDAAARLGVTGPGEQVWIGDQYFTVLGILDPVPLAPDLDTSVLVTNKSAQRYLGYDGHPTRIFERSSDALVTTVRGLLARAANPENPQYVGITRPSDALKARQAANASFTGLLVGLGAVALLVGGIGVANTMVIAVMERRGEIGLRRSLGAARRHISRQFLVEALLLSCLGGLTGAALGSAVTAGYAASQGWPTVIPLLALAGGVGATALIGMIAGLYPALRAARTSPTVALAAP